MPPLAAKAKNTVQSKPKPKPKPKNLVTKTKKRTQKGGAPPLADVDGQHGSVCGYFCAWVLRFLSDKALRPEQQFNDQFLLGCIENAEGAWTRAGGKNEGVEMEKISSAYDTRYPPDDVDMESNNFQYSHGANARELTNFLTMHSGDTFAFVVIGSGMARVVYVKNDGCVYLFDSHSPRATIKKFVSLNEFVAGEN